jgi:acid stress-induced BolA-like protein IbaG/YrbA
MVFNATFNNISAIMWQSVLSVEEIGVSGENHKILINITDNLLNGFPLQ